MIPIAVLIFSCCIVCQSDYIGKPPTIDNIISQDKPFRMQKLNLVWEKSLKKLSQEKLKLLYTDLKFQDKEEIAWKKLKTDGLDKNGLKESLVRGSFNAILEKYSLMEDFKILQDAAILPKQNENGFNSDSQFKHVFRDKKLNKLWLKAEQQGFTEEQLNTLKEEFQHHQAKIDQYYQIMDKVNTASWSKDDPTNHLEHILQAEEFEKRFKSDNPHQLLKEKHSELKAGYDYLNSQVIPNMKNMEFDEPQVNSLWEMAKNTSFTPAELESLRGELHHFEHRIRKLKTLAELHLSDEKSNYVSTDTSKHEKKLKEYNYKVDKIHKELASRIMERHTEL